MATISKMYKFEAAHILPRHPGKCSNMHGHSWKVEVCISGEIMKETGFVMDFNDLDEWVEPIIRRFDHRLLNCFVRYPSSEYMAMHICHLLEGMMPFEYRDTCDKLVVRVSETEKCWAEFVYDHEGRKLLHTAPADAEWRSPDACIKSGDPIIPVLRKIENELPQLQDAYINLLTDLEQLRLYIAMADTDPLLPDFTEKDTGENDRAN